MTINPQNDIKQIIDRYTEDLYNIATNPTNLSSTNPQFCQCWIDSLNNPNTLALAHLQKYVKNSNMILHHPEASYDLIAMIDLCPNGPNLQIFQQQIHSLIRFQEASNFLEQNPFNQDLASIFLESVLHLMNIHDDQQVDELLLLDSFDITFIPPLPEENQSYQNDEIMLQPDDDNNTSIDALLGLNINNSP